MGVTGSLMASRTADEGSFSCLVEEKGKQLQHALVAALGPEIGSEATSEALVYGWEHRGRVGVMDNPVGYLPPGLSAPRVTFRNTGPHDGYVCSPSGPQSRVRADPPSASS